MGKAWERNPEQNKFLKQKLPEFSEAQSKKRVSRFFENTFEEWFRRWPERNLLFGVDRDLSTLKEDEMDSLNEAIFNRKEQLRNYFYWHAPSRQVRHDGQANSAWLVELLTGKRTKGAPRQKKLVDVYSKLFYNSKIRVELDKRLKEAYPEEFVAEKKSDQYHSRRFTLLHQLKKEMFAKEPEEVRRRVEEERKRMAEEGAKEGGGGGESCDLDAIRNVETEIKNLPAVLDKIAKAVMERTGFATTILMGGIQHDGTLSGTIIHSGKTAAGGLTFQDTKIDFEESVLEPWGCFLERVYPPSKRKAQADFYKSVYKVENTIDGFESGRVKTHVWVSEDDGGVDEGEVPDNENSSAIELPNKEVAAREKRRPVSSSVSRVLPASTTEGTQTTLNFDPTITPTSSVPVPTMMHTMPPDFGSFPTPDPSPAIQQDHAIDYSNSNTSGLFLPSPTGTSWDQFGGFTSMTAEFNFAMEGLDGSAGGFSTDQNSSNGHATLLQQNTTPHGGVDMSYGLGMTDYNWQHPLQPFNNANAFLPSNPSTIQTDFTQNRSTLGSTVTASAISTNSTHNPPISSPAVNVNADKPSDRPNDTSDVPENSAASTLSLPPKDGVSLPPITGPVVSSGATVNTNLSGNVPPTVERPGDTNTPQAHTDTPLPPANNEPSSETTAQQSQSPFQEISSNIPRRQSGRPRKRKVHRDAEFEEQQEAREIKRKKVARRRGGDQNENEAP